jgi:uncharacterized protein (DUF924 family)
MDPAIDDIHRFWFGELDDNGLCAPQQRRLWFRKSDDTDRLCREQFGMLVDHAVAGGLESWADSDRGRVALVLLLDQFTRNIYRDSPGAFAGDPRALSLVQDTIADGHHQRLPAIHQAFLFLPLEHHEDLEVQEECVTLFEELAAVTGSDLIAGFTRYAVAHRDVIARFGRFPHRNAVLGRESTAAELAWLAQRGGF